MYEAIVALRRRLAEGQHAQDGSSCQRRGWPACGSGRPGAYPWRGGGPLGSAVYPLSSAAELRPPGLCRTALVPPRSPLSRVCVTMQEGGDAEEPTPLSEAERRDGATPRGDEVPSYSASAAGTGPKQATSRGRATSAEQVPETTWTATATGRRTSSRWLPYGCRQAAEGSRARKPCRRRTCISGHRLVTV